MELMFSHILNMSLTASIVIVLVLLIRLLLRRAPKIYAYALWSVVLFRLLCPVSLPSPVSILEPLHPQVSQSTLVTNSVTYLPIPASQPKPEAASPEAKEPASTAAKTPAAKLAVIPLGYLAVAAGMLSYGILSYLRLRRKLSEAVRYRRNVYLADHIQMPFVLGVIRPRIYLPSSLGSAERRYILAHERCHIRRGDPIWKVLACIALCVHWFNPLVWLSFVLAGRDMEMSCDEAVIRRLSPAVRADYASSLLRLSVGRRSARIPSLSFGAADPKARIRNMARWRKPALWFSVACAALCAAVLLACGVNPTQTPEETPPVQPAAQQPEVPTAQPTAAPNLTLREEFQNTAGDITFHLNTEACLDSQPLPTVEVEPRFLTEEDAQRVAKLFFGDTVGYESDYIFAEPNLSKQEIQDAIDRWTPYLDQDNIVALSGYEDEQTAQIVEAFLNEYRAMYETAPETVARTPCLWQFFEKGHYYGDFYGSSMIKAEFTVQDVPYTYTVETQNNSAYRGNRIDIWIREGGPLSMDSSIYTARLCRTDRPTQAQLEAVQVKAQALLDQMELGAWQIRSCTLQEYAQMLGEADPRFIPTYSVKIQACPVIQGIPVIAQEQALEATDDSYIPCPSASFEFSANGDLIHFELYDPIVEVSATDAVAPLSGPELTAAIRQCLMTAPAKPQIRFAPGIEGAESFRYDVYLENVAYEYICVAGSQSGAFAYVPCYALYCRQEQWGAGSGYQYGSGNETILYAALRADGGGVYY